MGYFLTIMLLHFVIPANETARRKRCREFVKAMIKARSAMKGEMDKRMIYGKKTLQT